MLSRITLKPLSVLPVLLPMLLLTACGGGRIEAIKPSPERTANVSYPNIPDGRVLCPDAPEKQCLDDEQTGELLSDFADALDDANAKLKWLADYFKALPN